MSIDLNTPNKFKAKIKITAVEKQEKIWFIQIEGHQKKLKAFPKQAEKFAVAVAEGVEAEADIEVAKEEYPQGSGEYTYPAYLRSFGGSNRGGGGGGRGGSNWQPEPPEKFLSGPVSAMTIRAFELNASDGKVDVAAAMATAKAMVTTFCESLNLAVAAIPKQASADTAPKPEPKSEPAPEQKAEPEPAHVTYAKRIFAGDANAYAQFKQMAADKNLDYKNVLVNAEAAGVDNCESLHEFVQGSKKGRARTAEPDSNGGWA